MSNQSKLRLEILQTLSELVSPTLPSLPSPPVSPPRPASPLPAVTNKRKLKEEEKDVKPRELGLLMGGKAVGGVEEVKRARIDPLSRPQPKSHLPPPLLNRADSKPPTPDLPSSAPHVKVEVPSHVPPSPLPQTLKPGEDWRTAFPKERLRTLGALYRSAGRELKHSGDATARSATSLRDSHLAIVQQAEAVLLYVFAFWCDDQAARGCIIQNWQSIFGLLAFVKRAAEKANLGIVVGVCLRMEAYIAFTLSNHEQKALSFRSSQLLQSPAPPSTSLHPSPLAHSHFPSSLPSPSDPPDPTSAATTELLKSFTKASADLFRTQKLWEESCALLSPSILAVSAPETWSAMQTNVMLVDPGEMVLPVRPWRFQGWGMELRRAMGVPQGVTFGRAVLEEWAGREGLGFVGREVREE